MFESEVIRISGKVRFVGQSDQFPSASGTICRVHKDGRFDVAYDCLANVREEQCRPEDWALLQSSLT